MNWLRLVLVFLAVSVVLTCVRPARAQGFGSRYRPSMPTLSPYFNLYRRDSGPLGNYHTFVRPQQQLRRELQQQSTSIQRQNASLRSLGQQVSRLERPSSVRPTGTGSVFMNYSHYYPSGGSFQRRR